MAVPGVDPKMQAALLSDPRVQEAMKKSGEEALNNPAVQAEIMKVAKEKFTAENAAKVANACKEWAQDPEVQAKARHYAGMAMAYAGQAGQSVMGCIEQGPDGVRYLCLIGSFVSIGIAGWFAFGSFMSLNLLFVSMHLFQMLFAFTTALFEAKPETIAQYGVTKYHDMLMEYFKLITTAMGRGVIYIYQGMLWLIVVGKIGFTIDPKVLAASILGLFFFLMGGLHIAMHYNIMPQEVVTKAKEAAGYKQVGS
jgi:hypothetical protein